MPSVSDVPVFAGEASRPTGVRRIIVALVQLGSMQLAIGVGGVVRNKVMALYLAPAGFGEFAQLITISAAFYAFVQFGMAVGLSRHTAAGQTSEDRQRNLGAANTLTLALALGSLALMIPVLLGSAGNPILAALGVRSGLEQKAILIILLAVAPIEALRNNYLSFLQGLLDISGISSRRVIAIVASTMAAVPLIALFRATGAAVQTLLASLIIAVLLGKRCASMGYKPLAFVWSPTTMTTLAGWGGGALLSAVALNGVDALIRARLISHFGPAENGLYQAALYLSALLTAVILGSVGAYSLAALSQTRDPQIVQARMEELLRTILPIATISLGFLGILAQPLLAVLFAPNFQDAAAFLPALLTANFVQAAAWILGAPLLGFGLIRTWTLIQLAGVALRYGTTVLLMPWMGPQAVPVGFLAAMTFDLLANIVVCRYYIGLKLQGRTALRFLAGAAAITAAALIGARGEHHLWSYLAAVTLVFATVVIIAWQDAGKAWQAALRWKSTWSGGQHGYD